VSHPSSGLMRRMIEAVTEPGEMIVNLRGSFATMDVELECGRHFLGTDLKA
jgi:hypothetical protein